MRAYDVFLRFLRRSTDVPAAPPGQISLEVVDTGGDPQLRMVDEDGTVFPVGSTGGSLEVDDGTTDVSSVTKINVPSGTLTDDGGGEVTLTATGVVVSDDTPLADSGSGDPGVSPDASRSDHVHPSTGGGGSTGYVLDTYSIDGTYGDDFTGASLDGAWSRRGFAGGDETYQVGKAETYLRVSGAGKSAGDGYLRTAPGGDWEIACAFVRRGGETNFGLAVIDASGTGIIFMSAYPAHTPWAPLLVEVSTYTSYGGNYVEPGVAGTSPNVSLWAADEPSDVKSWWRIRKNGTNYYGSYSLDGEAWGPESAALAWAGTVDRVGMLFGPISLSGVSNLFIDIDWLNKIA